MEVSNKKTARILLWSLLTIFAISFTTAVLCIGLLAIVAGLSIAFGISLIPLSKIVLGVGISSFGFVLISGFFYKLFDEALFDGEF